MTYSGLGKPSCEVSFPTSIWFRRYFEDIYSCQGQITQKLKQQELSFLCAAYSFEIVKLPVKFVNKFPMVLECIT